MAKARFHPLIQYIRGKFGGIVFRASHNRKVSAYPTPDMSEVKWSAAQVAHRERMAESFAYAKMAIADPEIRAIYVQMAVKQKKDKNRPFDMAVSDYYQGNNLLGDRFRWDVEFWRDMKRYRKQKKR